MKKQLAFISLSLMALTACNSTTVIPGSTINTRNKTIIYDNDETVADTKFDKRVAIYPITFGLVEKMRKPPVLSQTNAALEHSRAAYRYHIGKGDVLNIMVWAHTDLNSPVQQSSPQSNQVSRGAWVDESGYITYPLVGKIQAQGKTIDELQNMQYGDMSQNHLLSNGDIVYIPNNSNSKVYIMGEVGRQATLPIDNHGLNLTQALGEAGGMNQTQADATGVFVIRRAPEDAVKPIHIYQLNLKDATAYALGNDFDLRPNDIVYVTAAPITRWNRVVSQLTSFVTNVNSIDNTFK